MVVSVLASAVEEGRVGSPDEDENRLFFESKTGDEQKRKRAWKKVSSLFKYWSHVFHRFNTFHYMTVINITIGR